MTVFKANEFVPDWDLKTRKADTQNAFEKEIAQHLMELDLNIEQRSSIRSGLNGALLSAANRFFYPDPHNSSWIGYNYQRVLLKEQDFKLFFDITTHEFQTYLKNNWNRLMAERISAILIKADSALYAGFKGYFKEGETDLAIMFKGSPISPEKSFGVNINRMIVLIDHVFDGLLKFRKERE